MKTVNHYYEAVIRSRCVKHDLISFETEEEAIRFAEDSRWSWFDENEFEWNIEIEERDDENGVVFFDYEDYFDPDEEPDGE